MFCYLPKDRTGESSFLYLMLAASYFRQATRSRHSHVRRALRDLGREYIMKSHGVAPSHRFVVVPDKRLNNGLARHTR
jgi:hypothetical protein